MTTAIALALAGVLAVVCVLWVARPFTREPQPADDTLAAPEERRLALLEARDRVLAELKQLEFDHRTATISDEDYRAAVGTLRRQAADAIRALDALDAPPSPAEEPETVNAR
jgi:hypothetical protein